MTANAEGRLKEIESRMSGYPLVAVEDFGYALRLARLAASIQGAVFISNEHTDKMCKCFYCQWLRAFNSATSGEGKQ